MSTEMRDINPRSLDTIVIDMDNDDNNQLDLSDPPPSYSRISSSPSSVPPPPTARETRTPNIEAIANRFLDSSARTQLSRPQPQQYSRGQPFFNGLGGTGPVLIRYGLAGICLSNPACAITGFIVITVVVIIISHTIWHA
jgi:hypothetical protein